jgi:hypothetical protein
MAQSTHIGLLFSALVDAGQLLLSARSPDSIHSAEFRNRDPATRRSRKA